MANLRNLIDGRAWESQILAGGPGSGCHGPNCGPGKGGGEWRQQEGDRRLGDRRIRESATGDPHRREVEERRSKGYGSFGRRGMDWPKGQLLHKRLKDLQSGKLRGMRKHYV